MEQILKFVSYIIGLLGFFLFVVALFMLDMYISIDELPVINWYALLSLSIVLILSSVFYIIKIVKEERE